MDHDYDRFGNRSKQKYHGPGGSLEQHYQYSTLDHLIRLTLPNNESIEFDYFSNNALKQIRYPNGISTDYEYYSNGPVQSIDSKVGATGINHVDYVYNDILNITGLTDNGAESLYDYDGLNHLTDAQYPASSGLTNESYVYDRVGNRKDAGNPSAYDYDINHRIKNSPEQTYTFDTAGNLTSRSDGTQYSYDKDNRLKQLSTSESSAEYTYDPLGRRIKKSVNGIHTWFIWDGTRLLAETNESGTVLRQYIHAGDLPVALYEPGNENVSNCTGPDAVLTNIVVGAEQSFNCSAANSITTAENGLVVLEGGTAVLAAPEITLGTGVDIQEGGKLSANTVVNTMPEGREGVLYAIHTDHLGTPRYLSNSNASIIW